MLKIGDQAPGFTLVADDTKTVNLADYQGKNIVLLFFPMAYTSVCTEELCTMRDGISAYNDLDAAILAISVDSPFTLAQFKADQQLNFPLLSDFNKEVSQAYDTYYEEFVFGLKGVAKRSAFVIDKAGTIRYVEVLDNAGELPNFSAIKEALQSI
jgi:peroxiredoxin